MKRILTTLCLTLAVLLGSAGVSWSADFQKGVAAAKSGDYATALQELGSLSATKIYRLPLFGLRV